MSRKDTLRRIKVWRDMIRQDILDQLFVWLLAVIWDLLESLICGSEEGEVVCCAIQEVYQVIIFTDQLGELCSILALADELPDGRIWLAVVMMRSAMVWVLRVVELLIR